MKKYIIPIVLCCLCACNKVTPDTGDDIDKSGHTLFSVDIENLSLGQVKVPGKWESGDQIGVFGSESGSNLPYYLKRGGEGLQAAAFYGGLVKGKVLAYAPYDQTASSPAVLCNLERVQQYEPDVDKTTWFLRYNPRTFAALGEDGVLHFTYPMGLLSVRFEFKEVIEIQEIILSSTQGISGTLEADWSGTVQPSALSHKDIALDLGGEIIPSKVGGTFSEFLFVLPPAVYADEALTLNVLTTGEEMVLPMRQLEIKRVESSDFPVCSVVVTSSDLPGYEKEDGYLE